MNKFELVEDPNHQPERIFTLSELVYPDRFNVVRALFDAVSIGQQDGAVFLIRANGHTIAPLPLW